MSIMKDSMLLTISKFMKSFIQLIVTMILTRTMFQESYGTYKQLMLLFNILFTIVPLGIPTTVSYYFKNLDKEKRNILFTSTILMSSFLGIIVFLGVNSAKYFISDIFNNKQLLSCLGITSLYIAISIVFSFIENIYVSSDKAILLSKLNIIYLIVYLIVVVLVAYFINSIEAIMYAITILEVIKSFWLYFVIYKIDKYKYIIDFNFMKQQFKYSIPLGITAIVQTLNLYIDGIFISNMFSASEYAIYATGATQVPFVNIITVSLAAVALPQMSKFFNTDKNINAVIELWGKITIMAAIIIFPIFWILIFFGKGYTIFIYSEDYLKSVPIFLVYLLKLPLSCTIFGNILVVINKRKYILYNMIIGATLNIALNFILINRFGMIGAAISSVVIHIILIIMQMNKISKTTEINIKKLLPYKILSILFLIAGIMGLALKQVSIMIDLGNILNFFVYGCVIFISSILLYIRFNFIPREYVFSVIKKLKIKGE